MDHGCTPCKRAHTLRVRLPLCNTQILSLRLLALPQEEALLTRHFRELRDRPEYRRALCVTIVEANGNWHNAAMINNIAGSEENQPHHPMSMSGKEEGQTGVLTGVPGYTKVIYARNTNSVVENGKLSFADRLVSQSPVKNVDEFKKQLNRMHYEIKRAKDAFGKDTHTCTGKGPNQQDDLAMAFMMGVTYGSRCLLDPAFRAMCAQNGHELYS